MPTLDKKLSSGPLRATETILKSTSDRLLDQQARAHAAELARVKAAADKAAAATIAKALAARPAAPAPTSAPTGKLWTDDVRWSAYEHVLQHRGPEAANQWAKTFLPRAVKS